MPRRCLIDQKPRTLTVEDYRILCNCAEMVVRRLEKQQVEVSSTLLGLHARLHVTRADSLADLTQYDVVPNRETVHRVL